MGQLIGRAAWGTSRPPRIAANRTLIPKAFSSVSEARNCLEFYSHTFTLGFGSAYGNSAVHAGHGVQRRYDMTAYLDVFCRWSTAFDAMITTQYQDMTEREKYAAQVLQMQRLDFSTALGVISGSTGVDDQMLWDKYVGTFEMIISVAESVLKQSTSPVQRTSSERTPLFTLDIGIVGPLYDVARRCRDPAVRRKAICLLSTYPRLEGMWDSVLAARVAERVLLIEENGLGAVNCCADVPDWARTSEVHPIFDLEQKKALVYYQRCGSTYNTSRTTLQEMIEWGAERTPIQG